MYAGGLMILHSPRPCFLKLIDGTHRRNPIVDIGIVERSVLSSNELDGFLRRDSPNDTGNGMNFRIGISSQLGRHILGLERILNQIAGGWLQVAATLRNLSYIKSMSLSQASLTPG